MPVCCALSTGVKPVCCAEATRCEAQSTPDEDLSEEERTFLLCFPLQSNKLEKTI